MNRIWTVLAAAAVLQAGTAAAQGEAPEAGGKAGYGAHLAARNGGRRCAGKSGLRFLNRPWLRGHHP